MRSLILPYVLLAMVPTGFSHAQDLPAMPVELRADAEKTMTDKAQVIAFLKQSSRHLGDVMRNQPEGGLRMAATMFKQQTSYGNVFLFGATHTNEHVGQLVSYARMNGVVPPWSAKQPGSRTIR